jgi:gluconate 2-dehydrogenase gamma chain
MNKQYSKLSGISRRQFIQAIAAFSASWPITGMANLDTLGIPHRETYENLSDPWLTLASVQEHLFPAGDSSEQPSPGAKDIAALRFLRNMLEAPDTESEEKSFILNGVNWLNDLSLKNHQSNFIQLNTENKETVLRQIETSNAGNRWLSLIMGYLIEALLSDPVYGGNKDQQGWKWLEHIPGFPTPSVDKVYFKLGAHASPKRRTKA